jgi:hypothetical protein
MTRRAPHIPQRRRIFLGCEGQSELGYATLLARIARELPDAHIHIDARVLQPGAGNAFALVTRAAQIIANEEERREPYAIRAVLLDVGEAQINAAATTAATRHGIQHLIWQSPDHEALLLRHLPGCQQRRPPRGASLAALRREWADYEKGRSAQQLAARISLDGVRQACEVEADLRAFLAAIGIVG